MNTSNTYSSSPVATYAYSTEPMQSYFASFTVSGQVKDNLHQGTCYFQIISFDAQGGDVVTGTVKPAGVLLGIMDFPTYANHLSHAQEENCSLLISRYSEHIDSYGDSNNVLHFSWNAPSTDHYYFVILNAGYDNNVTVELAALKTGRIIVNSTEHQTQTNQLLHTIVVSSIHSTQNTPLMEGKQLPLVAAILLIIIVGFAIYLIARYKTLEK